MLTGSVRVKNEGYTFGLRGYDFDDNVAFYLNSVTPKGAFYIDSGIHLSDGTIPPSWEDFYLSIGMGAVSCSCYFEEEDGKKVKNAINKEFIGKLSSVIRGMKANCTKNNREDSGELFDDVFTPNQIVKYYFTNGWCKMNMKTLVELHYDNGEIAIDLEEDGSYKEKVYKITNVNQKVKLDLSEFSTKSVEDDWDFGDMDDTIFSLSEIIERNPDKSYVWLKKRKYYIVNDLSEVEKICKYIWKHDGIVAFDTETTGLYVNVTSRQGIGDRLVGMVFSIKPGEAFYFPVAHKKIKNICNDGNEQFIIEKYFKPILERKDLICHNGSYDWKVMYNYGICCNIVHDTFILFKVTMWNDHRTLGLGLKNLTSLFLHRDSFELKDFVQGKFGNNIKFWDLEEESVKYYACPDTDNLIELFQFAMDSNLLDKYGARKIYEIEVAFSIVIAYQEYYGHCVDISKIDALVEDIKNSKTENYAKMVELCGHDFNPASSKDLNQIVFNELKYPIIEYTDTGNPSCGKGARKVWMKEKDDNGNLKYPFAKYLHEWKESTTLESNFTKNISKFATEDGLMFSEVQQFLETGRLSVKNPNYQSYSDVVKHYIIPRTGYYALDADYSSVEARIMVSMAGCRNMVNKLKDPDADYHTLKASDMFGVPYELVSHTLRKMSKGVNFGILYGLGDPNLGVNLYGKKTPENTRKAKKQKELYFKGMEELRDFINVSKEQGVTQFYSETYFHRRRYFDPRKVRKDTIERQSCNARIQGTAADIYKIAMTKLFTELRKRNLLGKVLISAFVHDECFLEVHKSLDPCKVLKMLRGCMMLEIKDWCPLFIGAGFGRNWYEAKNTEIPVQVQQSMCDNWGTDGLDWWDGDSNKLYTWMVDEINDYRRDRVINYLKNKDNWNKVFSPVENSLAHEVLDQVKEGIPVKGAVLKEFGSSDDMIENLEIFCKVFDCMDLFKQANVQRPVHNEVKEEEHEEDEEIEEVSLKDMLLMRIRTLGVHQLRSSNGVETYIAWNPNNKAFLNVLSDFFKNHPGSSVVIAVDKDGNTLSTNMTMDPTAFPQLLRLFLTWKNMTA